MIRRPPRSKRTDTLLPDTTLFRSDFNSHVRSGVDQPRWRKALIAELDHYAEATPGRRLGSIFFGGGTPSLMAPETVAAVIERSEEHTSELQSLMRISYAVFCLKNKKYKQLTYTLYSK